MPDPDPCELCGTPAELIDSGGWGIRQRCRRCGEFGISGTAQTTVRGISQEDKAKLSGWVRDQNILGEIPLLVDQRMRQLIASPLPKIGERADRLLSYAIRNQRKLGDTFTVIDPALIAVTYSRDNDELNYLVNYLNDAGLIKLLRMGGITEITPAGYMRYEELQAEAA